MGAVSLEDAGKARWDDYRARYDSMSYAEVAEAHQWVWDNYPDQSHFSAADMDAFFDSYPAEVVVEVGGWRGEAAARQLRRRLGILRWTNYEICKAAVKASVPQDPHYYGYWLNRWVWETKPWVADASVLSHVIEHVSDAQLPKLLGWVARSSVKAIYIEAPLSDAGQGWYGGNTAHILTLGWDAVTELLAGLGYRVASKTVADKHESPPHTVLIAERGDG